MKLTMVLFDGLFRPRKGVIIQHSRYNPVQSNVTNIVYQTFLPEEARGGGGGGGGGGCLNIKISFY